MSVIPSAAAGPSPWRRAQRRWEQLPWIVESFFPSKHTRLSAASTRSASSQPFCVSKTEENSPIKDGWGQAQRAATERSQGGTVLKSLLLLLGIFFDTTGAECNSRFSALLSAHVLTDRLNTVYCCWECVSKSNLAGDLTFKHSWQNTLQWCLMSFMLAVQDQFGWRKTKVSLKDPLTFRGVNSRGHTFQNLLCSHGTSGVKYVLLQVRGEKPRDLE